MSARLITAIVATALSGAALAADVSYTKDVAPIIKNYCSECHGADSPDLDTWKANEKKYVQEKTGPRMHTYNELISYIGWPDTGAFMRRLDDGKGTADGKPGNMYRQLGSDEAERQKNLAILKDWVGEGAWNLNRWAVRGNVPAITKEQLDKLKLKY